MKYKPFNNLQPKHHRFLFCLKSSLSAAIKYADILGYRLKITLIPKKNNSTTNIESLFDKELDFDKETALNYLAAIIKNHNDDKKSLALFFIDLDDFKSINDQHGHITGDQLIEKIKKRIKAFIRKEDLFFRYGGDEFILLSAIEKGKIKQNSLKIYQRLKKSLSRLSLNHKTFTISASVGVSLFPNDTKDPQTLINNADSAMYQAKKRSNLRRKKLCFHQSTIEK